MFDLRCSVVLVFLVRPAAKKTHSSVSTSLHLPLLGWCDVSFYGGRVRLCGRRTVVWRGAVEARQEARRSRLLGKDAELRHTILNRVREAF